MKAYPFQHRHPTTGVTTSSEGMDLRDYFAARALQNFRDQIGSQSDQEWFDQMAEGAYRMADAMLKARESKDEQS
jgi:hypothetical protein